MTRFELEVLGSVEVLHDADLGWCLRGYSGPERNGVNGNELITAADPSLGVAALLTTRTIIASEGYRVIGDWHVDDDAHTAWVNVAPGDPSAGNEPAIEVVDAILEAESRWAREGIGLETPNGLLS